jgi:tripartite-type tricarboxylate transporter receptor subunit TctC
MPPGVPADRVALVRKAFDETMKDPKFLAEAKRFKRPVNPTNGVNLQRMWKESIAASPEDKAIVAQIFNPKGKK